MKKTELLNEPLSALIAAMGHTDRLIICDSGLSIPHGAPKIDLALTANVPKFIDTLKTIMSELEVEEVIVAEEMVTQNKGIYDEMLTLLDETPVRMVPHLDFKIETQQNGNVSFVRTGEASPFANIILISGVTFN
ncbi:MAG: D-ribose pyranase [Candidatus Marinimicrobia bacterium]|nr:D-ribose pyranase [Candidatus Neomarinimicrobiota bacterium]